MTMHTVSRPFSRLYRSVGRAMAVWAARRDLAQLDERMLQDLGISRAQALFEASRAPWDVRGR